VHPAPSAPDWAVIVSQPPYALAATPFRFPALAALAGRAPLGGEREIALATYLAARLAHDALADHGISQPVRAERAVSAKSWLSTLSLPASIRPALARLVEASGADAGSVVPALRALIAATSTRLDIAARSELNRLVEMFERAAVSS
jgi:hypothetical protein